MKMKAQLDNFWSSLRTGNIAIIDSDGEELLSLSVIGVNARKVDFKSFIPDVKAHCERIAKAINKGCPAKEDREKQMLIAPEIGSTYRHFKGDTYRVVGLSRCSDTTGIRVLYRNVDVDVGNMPWDRPLTEWNEIVVHDGKPVRRFQLIEQGTTL